jgi:hypothetical protein
MIRLLVLVVLPLALATPPAGAVPATNGKRKLDAAKPPRTARARPRPPRSRCRRGDPFCLTQVVRMDGAETRGLSETQVAKTMDQQRKRMDGCLIEARRRDPRLAQVQVEFVVTGKGSVLASRVDGKRGTTLARCLHKEMRAIRFPRSTAPRSIASVTLSVPQ